MYEREQYDYEIACYWKFIRLKPNRTAIAAVCDSMKNASADTQFTKNVGVVTACLPFQDDRLRL